KFSGFELDLGVRSKLAAPLIILMMAEMQDQLVCHGCRNTLLYPRGATNVRCALCNTVNMIPHHPSPHGMDMAHIVCGGCRTMLYVYPWSNTNTVPSNQFAHINCGNCRTTLMYPYGASSVKCAVCQFVTNVNLMGNGRVPNMPNGAASPGTMLSTSTQSTPPSRKPNVG
ncbi:hypothetical protein F2Q69_00009206, partial [Brassica cretica]